MRTLRAALPLLALLASAVSARAADLPPELGPLEKEAERAFQESGRGSLSATDRAALRKKAWDCSSKAAEILARHAESNPGDRERIVARRVDAVAIGWWVKREFPGGNFDAPATAPGAAPSGDPGSGNPFDDAASNPAAPAAVRPSNIEQAVETADGWARSHPHDLPGIQRRYLEALTSFPDQAGQATYLKAAERSGKAYDGLKEVYRRLRHSDPDSTQAAEVPEILRLLVVLTRELGNQDSAARERCAKVLGFLGSGEAVAPVGKAMRKEKVLQTLLAMGDALAHIGGRRAIQELRGMRDETELGAHALDWLGKAALRNPMDRAQAAGAIGSFALAKEPALASKAVDALLAFGPEAVPGLIEALGTNDFAARKKVMEALAQAKAPRAARALSNFLLTDDIPNAKASREAAWETIKALGMDAVPYLFPALRNPRTQYWTGMLLRETTGQNFASGRVTDWVDWWKKDHPDWKEQAE